MTTLKAVQPDVTMKFYNKFEYLADIYAKKVYNYDILGYEYDDVPQEMKIKVYTSIIGYGKRWTEYKRTQRYKPMKLEVYLRSALNNKVKDFINIINNHPLNNISIEDSGFDFSVSSTGYFRMDLKNSIIEINGINILENLGKVERSCFILFINGYKIHELKKLFRKQNIEVSQVITNKLEELKQHKEVLTEGQMVKDFYFSVEKDY